jgi:hypothetical protein
MAAKGSDATIADLAMLVGSTSEAVKNLSQQLTKSEEANNRAHAEILEKVDKHDNYLILFKVSGCCWQTIKDIVHDKDLLKMAVVLAAAFGLDFLARLLNDLVK